MVQTIRVLRHDGDLVKFLRHNDRSHSCTEPLRPYKPRRMERLSYKNFSRGRSKLKEKSKEQLGDSRSTAERGEWERNRKGEKEKGKKRRERERDFRPYASIS